MTTKMPTEHAEQVRVVSWFDGRYREHKGRLFSVPNGANLAGGQRQRFAQVSRLKAEGLRVGVPDLILPVARGEYHAMAIEMKRVKGGTLSEKQKAWIRYLLEGGWHAVVCSGADEAIEKITAYMGAE